MVNVKSAADILVRAHKTGQRIQALPETCRPCSIDEAYAIQMEVCKQLGSSGGWKVGVSKPDDTPICAPLVATPFVQSGATLDISHFHQPLIEMEIAYRILEDFPNNKTTEYSVD